jgi:hypothetical protein
VIGPRCPSARLHSAQFHLEDSLKRSMGFVFVAVIATTFVSSATLPRPTNVVAKKSILNQVGPIQTQTVYTPKTAGDFRVSIYLTSPAVTGTGANNYYISVLPSWTDNSGTWPSKWFGADGISSMFTIPGQTVPSQAGGSAVIHVKANTPIQIMDGGSGDVVDTYNVFVTIEKL